MATVRLIPPLNVLQDRDAGLGLGRDRAAVHEFAFDRVSVAHRLHPRDDTHLAAAFPERVQRILAALVGVTDNPVWPSPPQRPVQRLEHKFGAQMIGHRPAHHSPDECINNDREEQESGTGRPVGRCRRPRAGQVHGLRIVARPGPVRDEPCRCGAWCASLCASVSPPSQSLPSVEPLACVRHGHRPRRARRDCDAPHSAKATLMNVADARLDDIIVLPAPRPLAVSPCAEPARGDAEHAGYRRDAEAGLIRSHELERFARTEPVSRANQAAAFANISRSSRSWWSSQRRRRSSSRSALVNPSSRRPSSQSAGGPTCGWSVLTTRSRTRDLANRAPQANQLYLLVSQLRPIRQICSCHRGFPLPNGSGIQPRTIHSIWDPPVSSLHQRMLDSQSNRIRDAGRQPNDLPSTTKAGGKGRVPRTNQYLEIVTQFTEGIKPC